MTQDSRHHDYFLTPDTDDSVYSPSSELHHRHGSDCSDRFGDNIHNGDMRSHRSSISSLPGSVVIHPRSGADDNSTLSNTILGTTRPASGSSKKSKINKPNHALAAHVRDRDSPFRHPSSVRAMQMGDEDSEFDAISPASAAMTLKARKQRAAFRTQSPCVSEMSMSMRSGAGSPHPSQLMVPEDMGVEVKRDYPLVLLHCNLLQPSLSLPQRLGTPSAELLRDVLPDVYWRRWKLLEDKVIGSGVLRDRGVLISHPQEAYDVLEERLLESLELIKPRLAYGHFLGIEDDKETGGDSSDDEETNERVVDACDGAKCNDCGQKVLKSPEGGERKWEVRIYAANGLMRAGAWAAAWRDMEKVDVEVGLWLPVDIRRELERRMMEEETLRMEAEIRAVEEEKRRKEVYGESGCPPPDDMDEYLDTFEPEISTEPQSSSQPSFVRRVAAGFPFRKLLNTDFQGLFAQYTRGFPREPVTTLIAGILLLLAITYGSTRAAVTPSTSTLATCKTAPSFSPNYLVKTVTEHHTPSMYTTTVFASAPSTASGNQWPQHSPIMSVPTVEVNRSIPTGSPIAAVAAEPAEVESAARGSGSDTGLVVPPLGSLGQQKESPNSDSDGAVGSVLVESELRDAAAPRSPPSAIIEVGDRSPSLELGP